MDSFEILEKLAASGFASFLLAVLWAGKARVWVWGYHLEELQKRHDREIEHERAEKNEWKALALDSRDVVHRSLRVASKSVEP